MTPDTNAGKSGHLIPRALRAAGTWLLVALITIGLLEVVLRVFNQLPVHRNPLSGFHVAHEILGWTGKPHYKGRFRRVDFDQVVEHDEWGFRKAAATDMAPLTDATRIAFLGDSFTWGWGVPSGAVFTDLVQEDLGRAFRVRNFGVNAYGTSQQRLLLEEHVKDFAPHLVVVMFFFNDLRDNLDDKDGRRPQFELREGTLVARNIPVRSLAVSSWRLLAQESAALSALRFAYGTLTSTPSDRDEVRQEYARKSRLPDEAWALFEAILVDMKRVCHDASPACQLRLALIPHREDVLAYGQGERSQISSRTEAVCNSVGLPFLDLTPGLYRAWQDAEDRGPDAVPVYFPYDGHWDVTGHRTAARLMADAWDWPGRPAVR